MDFIITLFAIVVSFLIWRKMKRNHYGSVAAWGVPDYIPDSLPKEAEPIKDLLRQQMPTLLAKYGVRTDTSPLNPHQGVSKNHQAVFSGFERISFSTSYCVFDKDCLKLRNSDGFRYLEIGRCGDDVITAIRFDASDSNFYVFDDENMHNPEILATNFESYFLFVYCSWKQYKQQSLVEE